MTRDIVRKQYDQVAARYDIRWQSYTTQTLRVLHTWLDFSQADRVLDLACGTGAFEEMIVAADSVQCIHGIDLSWNMLQQAVNKFRECPRITFQQACATELPFADQQFDLIVCANSFHYFEQPVAALKEMKRLLSPTGTITILDWCKDYLTCRLCDLILRQFDPAYRQCYTQQELHSMMRQARLRVTRAQRFRISALWGLMVASAQVIDET